MKAWVIAGEGARGGIQAGIMSHLLDSGREDVPDIIYGVSSGAMCAAGFSEAGLEPLVETWESLTGLSSVARLNLFTWWYKGGFFNLKPTRKILEKMMARNTKVKTQAEVARLNWDTGVLDYVNNTKVSDSDFVDAVLDAVTIGGMFAPRAEYFDAGVRMIAPLRKAIVNDQVSEICVILGRPMGVTNWKPKKYFSAFGYFARSLDLVLYSVLENDIRKAFERNCDPKYRNVPIKVYAANELLYETLDFDRCKEGVAYGRKGNYSIVTSLA